MIRGTGFEHEKFNFHCGEMQVRVDNYGPDDEVTIEFEFEENEEIFELMLLADALKRLDLFIKEIYIPYVPFSRQDRINVWGESLSLRVFCSVINSLGAEKVRIDDPHSDVTPALLNNCVVTPQWAIFLKYFVGKKDYILISPDAGALKKIYKFAKYLTPLSVIECSKHRDVQTGHITHTTVNGGYGWDKLGIRDHDCYIVDDICDGGKTFIEIAKILKERGASKIILMVTHGFFTKGLSVFDDLIDEIYTRKGKVK